MKKSLRLQTHYLMFESYSILIVCVWNPLSSPNHFVFIPKHHQYWWPGKGSIGISFFYMITYLLILKCASNKWTWYLTTIVFWDWPNAPNQVFFIHYFLNYWYSFTNSTYWSICQVGWYVNTKPFSNLHDFIHTNSIDNTGRAPIGRL